MATEYGEFDEDDSEMSPMQMMMMPGFTTVTPEGKAKATEVFEDLYGSRTAYDEEEKAAYDSYEQKAQEAREVLKRAREVLAAKRTPTTKWLELAKGFGAPTRAGSFGESISNYAGERIPGRQREAEWESNRDKELLGYDTGMNSIDQQLALQRLKLRQAHRGADDKLMIEAMKIMGKPMPGAGKKTPRQEVQGSLDKAYSKDYLAFIQGGAADATKNIKELKRAKKILAGTDMVSGPAIGIVPKVMRDLFLPKSSETQESVESTVQSSLKEILGNQFTAPEGERLLARVYNPRFEEKVNARRVQSVLDRIERAYAEKVRAAKYFESHGGTLEGYTGKVQWDMDDFDPDIPEDDDPMAIARGMEQAVMGGTPSQQPRPPAPAGPPAPDEGMDEIDIEMLLPAQARGGRIGKPINFEDGRTQFAEGGPVQGEFPDGRPRFRMPDGKVIRARPGDDYDSVLQLYATATGTAPTRPGLPPQQIPPPDGVDEQQLAPPTMSPQQQMQQPPPQQGPAGPVEQPPTFAETALEELPSSLGYSAAGAAGAGMAGKLLPALMDRSIPGRRETPAQRRIIDMMAEQRRSPQDIVAGVRQSQRMGIPAMAMDDPSMRLTAESAMSESGLPNATEALARLKARQENISERVMDRVNTGLKPDEYFDQLDKLKENLYTTSKPLYDQAYAQHPAIKSKVLTQLLDTPDGKKAVKTALRVLRNEGKKIGKQDAMNMVTSPSLEFLDHVKRGLDDLITKEEGHGVNYKVTALGKSQRALRNALRDELDTATTPAKGESLYKKAREQYAGDLEVLDALQKGRDEFTKLQPQELSRVVKDMSFAEKDAYRTGVAQQLFEALEAPSTDFNAARKIIGSPAQHKKLRVLFDTDKQFELFETALQKESELYELSKRSIGRGEQGQGQHAEPQPGMFKRAAKHVPRLGWKSPTMWTLQFIRNNSEATEKKIDEVMKHLKASTPDELVDFEKTLGSKYGRRLSRKGRASKIAVAGALAGAAAKIATDDGGEDDAE